MADVVNKVNTFVPRNQKPTASEGAEVLAYYNNSYNGGFNPCITGGGYVGTDEECNVLANCVGYVVGRFNEIGKWGSCKYLTSCNAKNMIAKCGSLPVGGPDEPPEVGACMVWDGGDYGHVAIIEQVVSQSEVVVSDSAWSWNPEYSYTWRNATATRNGNNWKLKGYGSSYKFLGYIWNPAITNNTRVSGVTFDFLVKSYESSQSNSSVASSGGAVKANSTAAASNALKTIVRQSDSSLSKQIVSTDQQYTRDGYKLVTYVNSSGISKRANLLSYPALVESPFIELKIGDYTFGTYSKDAIQGKSRVQYPNYLTKINIVKVNGAVNTYTINMTYQIEAGSDPNLIDKVLASVGYNTIKISYGDWSTPKFIFKDEEALITRVLQNIDFAQSKIYYTIYCTSNALLTAATTFDFPKFTGKPSDKIKEILYNKQYKLTDIFQGMHDRDIVNTQGFIIGDDKVVEVEAKSLDPLSYINYLVTCMSSNTNTTDSPIQDSSYYLTIQDDINNEFGGSYFKIHKVTANGNILNCPDVYEIDVGYPGENLVMNFSILDDNSWSLLYDYSEKVDMNNYVYTIDDDGKIKTDYSLNITTSKSKKKTTATNSAWWTQMTQFPINATLTIKGLIRPVMLMTYLKINAIFYGQKHISSGLYIITKQEDTVDSSGYRTVLNLTRVAGDNDLFVKTTTSGSGASR